MTEYLGKACEILGIKLPDHVIIGAPDSYSFKSAGRLPGEAASAHLPPAVEEVS